MRCWVLEAAAGAVSAMPNLRTLVFLGLADTDDHACLFFFFFILFLKSIYIPG